MYWMMIQMLLEHYLFAYLFELDWSHVSSFIDGILWSHIADWQKDCHGMGCKVAMFVVNAIADWQLWLPEPLKFALCLYS